ncbi:MAG: AAA family ATPase [Candidatus Moranbacteria bacterium]|nr:AAA family ATPase [Candidatus Moranbacteria bacterium]
MTKLQLTKKYVHKAGMLPKQAAPLFFIFVGIPGSGKTTYAHFLEKYMSAVRVATDDIKLYYIKNKIKYVIPELFQNQKSIFEEVVGYNVHMISDSNSATNDFRQKLKIFAKKHGYVPIVVYCSADINTIKDRINRRRESGGIKNFYISSGRLGKYLKELEPPKKCILIDTTIEFNKSKAYLIKSLNKWIKK